MPAQPMLRCTLDGVRPGRHLVRLAYAAPDLSWRAAYRLTIDDVDAVDQVALHRSFELRAPGLPPGTSAHVRLVLGLPGGAGSPITVWEGDATLGGAPVELHVAPIRRDARIDRVYRGGIARSGDNPRFLEWNEDWSPTVWRELSFKRLPTEPPGRVRVGVRNEPAGAIRWFDGAIEPIPYHRLRIPLTPDPDLVGFRRKRSRQADGTVLLDEITFSVANRGTTPATVAVEEELRPIVARADILRSRLADRDHRGELLGDRWRTTLTIPAGELVQGQLVLRYTDLPR
jgi:hypothetical protein